MRKEEKLALRDWQNYHIKQDPGYGDLIASILQSIFKSKYISLDSFSEAIEKNASVVLSGEGLITLLLKIKNLIDIIPKFYITNYFSELKKKVSENSSPSGSDFMLTIRCDFIIWLNKDKFTDLTDDYISVFGKARDVIGQNNKNILTKYMLKQLTLGNYFIPTEFLEEEIFRTIISYTGCTAEKIYNKFRISEYSTFNSLFAGANLDEERKNIENNIKVINIPFTSYHVNNYFNVTHQRIYRDDFGLGKKILDTKAIYLNSNYYIEEENITIYEKLVNHVYYKYLSNNKSEKSKSKSSLDDSKEKIEDIDEMLVDITKRDALTLKKDLLNDEYYEDFMNPLIDDKVDQSKSAKELILNTLKKEKVSKHELNFIDSIDKERMHIKKTFVTIIDKLTNPFLANVVDLANLKFLKQYIITNYGESLKEEVPEELRNYIEKKYIDYVRSRYSQFVEYLTNTINVISEFTDEKEVLVETVIKNSQLFKHFAFKKYLNRPKRLESLTNFNVIKVINREYCTFHDKGEENEIVVIPYIKIKEFLIHLISEEIIPSWEKLSLLFNDLLPQINKQNYSAGLNKIEIHMTYTSDGIYDITAKDDTDSRSFSIKNLEDIEYIFQDKDLKKYKDIIGQLYMLHQKAAFGFNNKVEFEKYMELYNKRCDDYYYYKKRIEDLDDICSNGNFLIATIKKIIYWLPRFIDQYFLTKIMRKNFDIKRDASYHYLKGDNYFNKDEEKEKIVQIKDKISDLVESKEEKEKYLLKSEDHGSENGKDDFEKIHAYKQSKNHEEKTPLPQPLLKLDSSEEKLFYSIKDYLQNNKDIVFTHDTDESDENIVIYIKNKDHMRKLEKGIEKEIDIKDINTIEEIGAKYSVIRSLIEKRYLVQKTLSTIKDREKVFALFLSKSFYYYNKV